MCTRVSSLIVPHSDPLFGIVFFKLAASSCFAAACHGVSKRELGNQKSILSRPLCAHYEDLSVKPSLAILLPVYNAQHHLEVAALDLLEIAAELTDRLELLIIDDGSTDQTIEIARCLATRFPQIDTVRHSARRGLGPVIQLGLRRTTGQVLVVHDGVSNLVATVVRRLLIRSLAIAGQPDMPGTSRWIGTQRDHREALQPSNAQISTSSTAVGGFHWFERRTLQSPRRSNPGLPQPWHVRGTVRQCRPASQGPPLPIRQDVPHNLGFASKSPSVGR